MYSPSINKLIAELKKLPGVGQHTAERFVLHWLKAGKKEVGELLLALKNLMDSAKSCETCWNFSDSNPCPLCQDSRRQRSLLCVVSEYQAIPVLERTGAFTGMYHVLRGTIDAETESLGQLKITELMKRLTPPTVITEVILALNPDLPGETTMMYLHKQIQKNNPKIRVTRLARGLPLGSDLQYADDITLTSALKHRT